MELIKWTPGRDLFSVRNHMSRFFDDFFPTEDRRSHWTENWVWHPTVDVIEADDSYVISADLPGVDKKDIQVDLKNDILTITGERSTEDTVEEKSRHRRERAYGKFRRSFTLPADVDPEKITADYKDGVLTVRVAKPEARKPRPITVH